MASYPLGFDYSAGRPSGASLKAAGARFVIRYIDRPGTVNRKLITKAEYDDVTSHGVAVYLVIEHGTTDWGGGTAAGAALARSALAGADAIGYPRGMPIFVTADGHMIEHDLPTWVNFVRGAASVLGRHATGGYAFSEGIDALTTAAGGSPCDWYWQPGSRSALRAVTHVYQANDRANVVIDGVVCDVDEMHRPLPLAGSPANGGMTMDADVKAAFDTLKQQISDVNRLLSVGDAPDSAKNPDGSPVDRGGHPWNLEAVRNTLSTTGTKLDQLSTKVDATAARLADIDRALSDMAAQQAPALDYAALAGALLDAIAARRAAGGTP